MQTTTDAPRNLAARTPGSSFGGLSFRADDEIKQLESALTIVGGNLVHGTEEFSELASPAPPVLQEWSPVAAFGAYAKFHVVPVTAYSPLVHALSHQQHCTDHAFSGGFRCFCWAF